MKTPRFTLSGPENIRVDPNESWYPVMIQGQAHVGHFLMSNGRAPVIALHAHYELVADPSQSASATYILNTQQAACYVAHIAFGFNQMRLGAELQHHIDAMYRALKEQERSRT